MIPEINLLPSRDREQQRITWILMILLIIWLVLLGVILLQYYLANNEAKILNSRIETLTLEKEILENQVQDLDTVETEVSLEDAVSYVEKLTVPVSETVEELLVLLPEHSYLSDYSYSSGSVSIQTQFESLDMIAQYVANLEASEIVSDVQVNMISTHEPNGDEGTTEDETQFTEVPRYDVSFSISVDLPALVLGGADR